MDYYADNQSVSDVDIEKVERVTRGQSNNEVWRQLKRDKLTASNFHDAAVRRKEPDKFLRNIMCISQINTQINEADPEIAMDKLYKIIIIITHFNSWNINRFSSKYVVGIQDCHKISFTIKLHRPKQHYTSS